MASTYDKIATTTLSSTSATITFSSIAASWTDLRLVLTGTVTSAASPRITFNSDSTTNYSDTGLAGDGTSATSDQLTNRSFITIYNNGMSATIPEFYTLDIFSYAGSTYKTALGSASEDRNGSGSVKRTVSLWRSTSAITSITITTSTSTFASGTTATLYGILKA